MALTFPTLTAKDMHDSRDSRQNVSSEVPNNLLCWLVIGARRGVDARDVTAIQIYINMPYKHKD